jgi:hypothetical protein
MVKKLLFSLLIFFSFVNISYSATNVTCGNIYAVEDDYYLNQSISIEDNYCLVFVVLSSSSLDCNGFNITTANDSLTQSGVELNTLNNFEISNCNIINFQHGLYISNSNNVTLNQVESNNNDFGIQVLNSNNNYFTNVETNNNLINGIGMDNSTNNLLSDITSTNNQVGIYFKNASDNNVTSSLIINNSLANLFFSSSGGGPYSNLFYGNILGNFSRVLSSDDLSFWNNKLNLSTTGNTYYNYSGFGTGLTLCADVNNCDYQATIINFPQTIVSTLSSVFPFSSLTFFMVLFISLGVFLF